MYSPLRLSRLSYPRATWWVMLLLALVFVAFGIYAEACLPESSVPVMQFTSNGAPNWVGQILAPLSRAFGAG